MDNTTAITLKSLESELAGFYAGLAVILDECFMPGAGRRMLAVSTDGSPLLFVDYVDVRRTRIGKLLPVWFSYAYQGVLSAGYSPDSFEQLDGPLERLGDLLGLLRTDDVYFDDCLSSAGMDPQTISKGHLQDLVLRINARIRLDQGNSLSLQEMAVLAEMNERSVRNALSVTGESKLAIQDDGQVANEEAIRWLGGRRNFKPTQRRELPKDLGTQPDSLDAWEIPKFIESRLSALQVVWAESSNNTEKLNLGWSAEAAKRASVDITRIDEVQQLPLNIRPSECSGLAKLLEVDPVWFTYQVMSGLFPDQVDMLLNPSGWRSPIAIHDESKLSQNSITIELSGSMLKHGYLDIPVIAKDIFPKDCFGSRATDDHGEQIELSYGSYRVTTDIRMKSEKTLSPRKRFSAWLNKELQAKPGDRIRIDRVDERRFSLTHIAT